ncbi:MAG: SpaA isopeptide-forming pilin-related protein, partial [Clostridia bacterium]
MNKYFQKSIALLMTLTMLLSALPTSVLAETSAPYEINTQGAALKTAFEVVDEAIKSNETVSSPHVSAMASANPRAGIPTGEEFSYEISYTLNNAPTYLLKNGNPVAAYDQYKHVTFTLTPPENVVVIDKNGIEHNAANPYVIDLGDVKKFGSHSFMVNARMTNNGSAPNGSSYGPLVLAMTADVSVTDQNLGQTQEKTFTGHILLDTNDTTVQNIADSQWMVNKVLEGEPKPDGMGSVVFTYRIKVGKAINGKLSAETNDYDKTGILNFTAFALTDVLPVFTGVSGKDVKPTSATLVCVQTGTVTPIGTSTALGADGKTLQTNQYNTITTTGTASAAGDTPAYTEYLVTASYPQAEFKLPYAEPQPTQTFTLTNNATIDYTLVGTAPATAVSEAQAKYRELTEAGFIQVAEMLELSEGSQKEVPYNAFYNSVFTGSANFAIYKAQDVVNGVPAAGATAVANLSVTDTTQDAQTKSKALAPGEYVVLQTTFPKDTAACSKITYGGGTTANQSWINLQVTEKETAKVTFLNPVIGKGLLRFTKQNENKKGLAGAEFTFVKDGTTTPTYTITTQQDGSAFILLPVGSYQMTETKAPDGYVLQTQSKPITITQGQTTDITGDPIINYKNDASLTFYKYAVQYEKAGRDYTAQEKKPIHEIKGTQASAFGFTLERSTDPAFPTGNTTTVTHYQLTDASSSMTVKGLPRADGNGNYYWYRLSESTCADASFTKDSHQYTWQFKDANKQEASFYNVLQGSFKFRKEQHVLSAGNPPSQITYAAGKKFNLYTKDASGSYILKGALPVTDAQGFVTTALLPMNDPNGLKMEYYIQEDKDSSTGNTVVYPADSTPNDDYWGPITLADWSKATDLTDASKHIINKENKGQIQIRKIGADTKAGLIGAEFKVYTLASDKVTKTYIPNDQTVYTTDANGMVLVSDLPIGLTYYVEEVKAPAGYRLSNPSHQEILVRDPLTRYELTFTNDAKPKIQLTKEMIDQTTNKKCDLGNGDFTFTLYRKQADGSMTEVKKADGTSYQLTVNKQTNRLIGEPLEEAGNNYYLLETATPSNAIPPAIQHIGTGEKIGDLLYFGPYTLQDNKTTDATIQNALNRGKIYIRKTDAKTGSDLKDAAYTVTVEVPEGDKETAKALTAAGFGAGTPASGMVPYTRPNIRTNNGGYFELNNLPLYGMNGKALSYAVVESAPPAGYFPPDDNTVKTQILANQDKRTATYRYANAPKVSVTIKKFLKKHWEVNTGHYINYPLNGVELAIYEIKDHKLEWKESITTKENGKATFNNLDATKTYAFVEIAKPDACELPDGKKLPVNAQELQGQPATCLTDYNSLTLDLMSIQNLNATENIYEIFDKEALLNYESYAQFKLIKQDATDPTKLLDHAKFLLHSCTQAEYETLYKGKTNKEIVTELKKKNPNAYIYETGTVKNESGSFLTEAQIYGDVFWFEEIKEPAGYEIVGDGIIGPLTKDKYNKNGITNIEVKNTPITGPGTEDLRYFQVQLDKVLYINQNKEIPLANVTFELWLADGDFKKGALLTKFTTGTDTQEGQKDPGRGISESFEFGELMRNNKFKPYITVTSQSPINYKANFVLREVSYPADSTPVQFEYPLTIETRNTEVGATYLLDTTYTNANKNPIVNNQSNLVPMRVRKMGYNVANGVPTLETEANLKPLQGVEIGIYSDQACTRLVTKALTNAYGYANFMVNRNTTYYYKEIATIDGYDISGSTGAIVSPDYRGEQTITPVIFDPAYRNLTLKKIDAAGNPAANVVLRITNADGTPIKDANGREISQNTLTTNNDGITNAIALPNGTYSVEEVSINGNPLSDVEKSYFKLVNQNVLPITFGANEAEKTVSLVNPGKGSIRLDKKDDVGVAMPNVSFAIQFKPFTNSQELVDGAPAPTADDPGFKPLTGSNANWVTDAQGLILKTDLLPGWYKITETVPPHYVGYQQPAQPVTVVKGTGVHLGQTTPAPINVSLKNVRKGHLTIQKDFEPATNAPATLKFNLYTSADLKTPASPAFVDVVITNGTGSATVELDPATYYVVEQGSDAWYGKYSLNKGAQKWVNGAIEVIIQADHTTEKPVSLHVCNVPSSAKISLLKTDDSTPALPLQGVKFAIYYVDEAKNKLFYQQDQSWLAGTDASMLWTTDVNGGIDLQFKLPFDRLLKDEKQTQYWLTEVYTPIGHVPAADVAITATPGSLTELKGEKAIVNTTGLYISLTKYGRTHEHTMGTEDVLANAEFTLYRVKGGKSVAKMATISTDHKGQLTFPNLPKLQGNEYYAIAETNTPDTHVDGSLAVYFNGNQLKEAVTIEGKQAYVVAQSETVNLDAYNTPKGSLAVLKYNYLKFTNEQDVPKYATFEVTSLGDQGASYTNTKPVDQFLSSDPQTLTGASTLFEKGSRFYVGKAAPYMNYLLSDCVFTGLAPGQYLVHETQAANGFYYTPDSKEGDPWYHTRTVTVDDNGGVAVCVFANIPNPDLPDLSIQKKVVAIDGDPQKTELQSLQNGWQSMTYRIYDFASTASNVIQLNLKWLELEDVDISFQDRENQPTQVEHYVEAITIGACSYLPTQLNPNPKQDKIYATVYGWKGAVENTKQKIATVDVTGTSKNVSLGQKYDGFSIIYGTDALGNPSGLSGGFKAGPVDAVVFMRQENKAEVHAAAKVLNKAKVRMAYDIGTQEVQATSWKEALANAVAVSEEKIPSMQLHKTSVCINEEGMEVPTQNAVQPGGKIKYTITLTNVSQNGAEMVDPVLIDQMPSLVDFDIANVAITAPTGVKHSQPAKNGQYAYCTFTGKLAPNASITMTLEGTVKYATVENPSGKIENAAFALSTHLQNKNHLNPTGTSFGDEKGQLPTHPVEGSIFGGEELSYLALKATTTNNLEQTSSIQLYKLVSADLGEGVNSFYGSNQYAIASVGGEIRYKLVLVNGGQSTIDHIRVIDKLPHVGDTTVGTTSNRYSAWQVDFTKVISVTHTTQGDIPYTLHTTKAQDDRLYANALKGTYDGWATGQVEGARGLVLEFPESISLAPKEQICITLQCKAPAGETAKDGYFRMAANDTNSSFTVTGASKPRSINSATVKVTLSPAPVSLGNRVWLDVNGNGLQDYASGENIEQPGSVQLERDMTASTGIRFDLRSFVNSNTAYATTSQALGTNGFYQFNNLYPAKINPYDQNTAYDANRDIKNDCLLGDARSSYQLAVSGIPAGYMPTVAFGGGAVPDYEQAVPSRKQDSNFKNGANGVYTSEKFYLKAEPSLDPSFDLGLLRYRHLQIAKSGSNGSAIAGATFKIYGPYEQQELHGIGGKGLVLDPSKLVDTIGTNAAGIAKFTSTGASHYLNFYRNYVVVESASPQAYYLRDGLIAKDNSSIASAAAYPAMSGGDISKDNYFILKARTDGETIITENVNVVDEYVSDGSLMISGQKNMLGGILSAGDYEFVLTATGTGEALDADFLQANPNGLKITNDADGKFAFPAILYGYSDRDHSYLYTLQETNAKVAGITYDATIYQISVSITDNGNGTLKVDHTITQKDGKPVTDVVFNNKSHGLLTLEKRVAGNAGDVTKAFTFTIQLTNAKNKPLTGT